MADLAAVAQRDWTLLLCGVGSIVVLGPCSIVAFKLLRLSGWWRLRTLSGPPALPILGNLASIIAAPGGFTGWRDTVVKKYGNLYKIWLGAGPAVVVSDTEIIRKVVSASNERPSFEVFSGVTGENHYIIVNGLLSLSPEQHGNKFRTLRKAFDMAVMSPASLKSNEPMLQQCVERLVARLARSADSGEPIDMASTFSDMTMEAIGFAAFGVDLHCNDVTDKDKVDISGSDWVNKPGTVEFGRGLTDAARTMFRLSDPARGSPWKLPGRFFPEVRPFLRYISQFMPDKKLRTEIQARNNINAALRTLIKQWGDYKTAQQNKDTSVPLPAMSERGFLAKLLDAAESEGLSELDVIAQMLLAGYETTATALADCLLLLTQNPKQMALLQAEVDSVLRGKRPSAEDVEHMPYLRAVVDETLRLLSPADVAVRNLHDNLQLSDGKVIPSDVFVFLALRSVHLDPSIWPRADEFLPQRWLPGHEDLAPKRTDAFMPWGLGARMCPGYKFALLEARLALARLMQAYTFAPAPGLPKPKFNSGIVYAPDCLWMDVKRRSAAAAVEE